MASKSGSSTSSAGRARAKAEAAKIRANYAEKQLELQLEAAAMNLQKIKRDAEIEFETTKVEAQLEALRLQCEAEATSREAQILEMEEQLQIVDEVDEKEQECKMIRTMEYVNAQNAIKQYQPSQVVDESQTGQDPVPEPVNPVTRSTLTPKTLQSSQNSVKNDSFVTIRTPLKKEINGTFVKPERNTYQNPQPFSPRHFNINARPFVPFKDNTAPATDSLAQYLARRDLTNCGLYSFDDKPENYRAWYASFISTTSDIQQSAVQLLDLMIRWLGKESREYVKRIRAVHVNNPNVALYKAWERLEEYYAAPEIIEKSLFERLENFPRLNAKDNVKLRELGDLLTEILGAKEDGYLTGLAFLDTSRGILPIVAKLPFGLQERWLSTGSKYKVENNGLFPPFHYFCEFVCSEAKKRNDPSFMTPSAMLFSKPDKTTVERNFNDRAITVQKTDIFLPQSIKTTHF